MFGQSVSYLIPISHSFSARRTICLPQPIRQDVNVRGGMDAGNFKRLGSTKDMNECLRKACKSQAGNIAILIDNACFSVSCNNLHSCDLKPEVNSGIKTAGALYRIIGEERSNIGDTNIHN